MQMVNWIVRWVLLIFSPICSLYIISIRRLTHSKILIEMVADRQHWCNWLQPINFHYVPVCWYESPTWWCEILTFLTSEGTEVKSSSVHSSYCHTCGWWPFCNIAINLRNIRLPTLIWDGTSYLDPNNWSSFQWNLTQVVLGYAWGLDWITQG